ncbi:lebercilin-like protein [Crotalus tigris]|uniref:lebercilin-like protein n=1 Tax=Crotalus tigris TaxID=88082 RepID=UPI00192F909F|nr:lebercilin-like protein [Crotalus tigris]
MPSDDSSLHHTVQGKTFPEKKPQQKITFTTDHTINTQEKNNKACRLLSSRDHKIKELKNEVAFLRNKLETFAMENTILKRLLRTSEEEERRDSKKLREVQAELLKTTDTLLTFQKLSEDKKHGERGEPCPKLTSLPPKLEASDKRIQERERELSITDIYAEEMRKRQPEKGDSSSSPKVVKVSQAIRGKISLKPRTLGMREPEGSRMTFHEVWNS